jgi:hypothetical protein
VIYARLGDEQVDDATLQDGVVVVMIAVIVATALRLTANQRRILAHSAADLAARACRAAVGHLDRKPGEPEGLIVNAS